MIKNNDKYFEGWYFKISDRKLTMAIIVGVSKTKAFIQTIDTYTNQSQMIDYQLTDFKMNQEPFYLKLKDNLFTKEKIILNLNNGLIKIRCILNNSEFTPLQTTTYAPSIMGPFTYFKNMECNHGIISLRHQVTGKLIINQQKLDINGIGYIEKDWGYSFPQKYLWLQSNDCLQTRASIFLAIAKIPVGKISFTGIIMNLMIKDKQFKIASYYGAYVKKVIIKNNNYYLVIKQYPYRFYFKITYKTSNELKAPQLGKMIDIVKESLDSHVSLIIYKHHQRLDRYDFTSCGLELFEKL